ncbi:hypothetical protein KP509_15G040100 [Ceratopteris richardii]|nr:hypothetical protein KP509_15G040100 [Ceratopteris richardii]
MEVVKVDMLIELSSLQDSKKTLIICHSHRFHVHEAYLDHLHETFCFYGLDVHLLSIEKVLSDSDRARNAKVILFISSNTSSIQDFEKMLTGPAFRSAEIIYIIYGPQEINNSTSKPCFQIQVNFEKSEFNRAEFKAMVNKVVEMFNIGVEKTNQADIDFPVGLGQRVDVMKSRILTEMQRSDTSLQCFGIWGMGGAGKTTIAKSIYNGMHMHFEKSYFCLNTSANFAEKGVVDVQRKIICGLLGKHDRGTEINDEETGKALLECELKGINALIVFDDVDSDKQLNALYRPICSSLGRNSVIIMSSRDRRVLESVQPKYIFQIKGLNNREHSERLFYWHAFLKAEPPAHLSEVSRRIIDACQGLPLSLKVMGAHLHGYNDESYWDESLRRLRQNVTDIVNVLKISLNGLEANEMEAFLDICCFLIGEEEETACSVLEGCYGLGRTYLEALKNRCLITIAEHRSLDYDFYERRKRSRVIEVHDQIRDMGRRIIREERRDRAWDEETAEDILKDEMALPKIRGLSISSDFSFPKEATKCKSLPQLKILVVKQVDRCVEGIWETFRAKKFLEKVRCEELRWLKWRRAPFRDVPLGICSKSLRVLDLAESAIKRLPTVSLTNLQSLDMSNCYFLKGFGSSTEKLKHLRYLNLNDSHNLKCPTKEIEGLRSLELLTVRNCKSLRTLSSLATTLRTLHLSECESLESLEASSSLPHLRDLTLRGCDKIKALYCKGCQSLERLQLIRCYELESLEMPSLPNLRHLNLDGCHKLKEVDCGGCQSLQHLELFWCHRLESLEMHSLPNLRHVTLHGCDKLKELDCGGLPSLQTIYVKCQSLKRISFLPRSLQRLGLKGCDNLRFVDGLDTLTNLRGVRIERCPSIAEESLPEHIKRLPRLPTNWFWKYYSIDLE